MLNKKRLLAAQSETYSLLENLTMEKDDWKIKVRVFRLWNVVNANNKDELISIEMVLIDEKNFYIHVIIKSNIAHSFRGILNEGSVYMIKNFSVIDNKSTYRVVSDNKLMIQFYSNTIVKEVTFDLHKLPEHKFDLIEFEKVAERIGKIYTLTDIIGEITGKGNIVPKNIKGREIETLEIELKNLRNKTVKITLWGKSVEDYQKETSLKGVGNRVGVFTSNLVKEYQNTMYVSTTPASKVYFNLQIPEVEEFNSCLSDGPIKTLKIPKKGTDTTEVIAKKKMIADILQEANSNFEQDMTFYCLATIKGFSNKNGWNFPACARHKTLAKAAGTKFWCQKCMLIIDDAVVRYRLKAEVGDETGSTKFIIFDDEAKKIIGITAKQLHDLEEENDEIDEQGEVPRIIQDLKGQAFVFQIKITNFNKTVRNQSFTAAKIFDPTILEKEHVDPTYSKSQKRKAHGKDPNDSEALDKGKKLEKKPKSATNPTVERNFHEIFHSQT